MHHDDHLAYLYELHDPSLPRLGPGDDRATRRALDTLLAAGLKDTAEPKILDIGCGNGAQTLALAGYVNGTILAVDNHRPFLDELQRRAETAGLSNRIETRLRDMGDMGLPQGSFDLIWSEGAFFVLGFPEALALCRELLVPGGFLAASEISWLRSGPPADCLEFFAEVYPAMVDVETNLAAIESRGYEVLGHFTLPDPVWWESYYNPVGTRLETLQRTYAADPKKRALMDLTRREIEQFRKNSSYYGNVYYLMRRR